ncbi:hypothetical protein NEPAR04_0202 [Nematocida parisii]|nr:hypothetical protein NEPAR03_0196 [Nematocida parisii]KAI5125710.1 hypothetical protein NEPAR08_0148 [Nematocida parisii]KAI5140257.1 hypothetical protein NEPAR04_0202 [Nematocida parisii]
MKIRILKMFKEMKELTIIRKCNKKYKTKESTSMIVCIMLSLLVMSQTTARLYFDSIQKIPYIGIINTVYPNISPNEHSNATPLTACILKRMGYLDIIISFTQNANATCKMRIKKIERPPNGQLKYNEEESETPEARGADNLIESIIQEEEEHNRNTSAINNQAIYSMIYRTNSNKPPLDHNLKIPSKNPDYLVAYYDVFYKLFPSYHDKKNESIYSDEKHSFYNFITDIETRKSKYMFFACLLLLSEGLYMPVSIETNKNGCRQFVLRSIVSGMERFRINIDKIQTICKCAISHDESSDCAYSNTSVIVSRPDVIDILKFFISFNRSLVKKAINPNEFNLYNMCSDLNFREFVFSSTFFLNIYIYEYINNLENMAIYLQEINNLLFEYIPRNKNTDLMKSVKNRLSILNENTENIVYRIEKSQIPPVSDILKNATVLFNNYFTNISFDNPRAPSIIPDIKFLSYQITRNNPLSINTEMFYPIECPITHNPKNVIKLLSLCSAALNLNLNDKYSIELNREIMHLPKFINHVETMLLGILCICFYDRADHMYTISPKITSPSSELLELFTKYKHLFEKTDRTVHNDWNKVVSYIADNNIRYIRPSSLQLNSGLLNILLVIRHITGLYTIENSRFLKILNLVKNDGCIEEITRNIKTYISSLLSLLLVKKTAIISMCILRKEFVSKKERDLFGQIIIAYQDESEETYSVNWVIEPINMLEKASLITQLDSKEDSDKNNLKSEKLNEESKSNPKAKLPSLIYPPPKKHMLLPITEIDYEVPYNITNTKLIIENPNNFKLNRTITQRINAFNNRMSMKYPMIHGECSAYIKYVTSNNPNCIESQNLINIINYILGKIKNKQPFLPNGGLTFSDISSRSLRLSIAKILFLHSLDSTICEKNNLLLLISNILFGVGLDNGDLCSFLLFMFGYFPETKKYLSNIEIDPKLFFLLPNYENVFIETIQTLISYKLKEVLVNLLHSHIKMCLTYNMPHIHKLLENLSYENQINMLCCLTDMGMDLTHIKSIVLHIKKTFKDSHQTLVNEFLQKILIIMCSDIDVFKKNIIECADIHLNSFNPSLTDITKWDMHNKSRLSSTIVTLSNLIEEESKGNRNISNLSYIKKIYETKISLISKLPFIKNSKNIT